MVASHRETDRRGRLRELECRRHLLLIHDAILSHRRVNGDWPERLSDLVGRFIAPEVLICPECLRQGVFRPRDDNLRSIVDSDSLTVYKWELSTLQKCPGMEEKNWREWKLAAAGDAGGRCGADRPLRSA